MHRRISSAEKGKAIALEHLPAPRKARVKITAPDASDVDQSHALTIIGRITNPSIQKVWSLIPFFTEHWKADIPPVGTDLGLRLFKFQFEFDLLTVIEKQPYHYARWMLILQRWEPTISPRFPSMIPFWIKIQGVPIHLWKEGTARSIAEGIGTFEVTGIIAESMRMRVHVNGRLPLIKSSVLEFDNGDELTATLVYERLEKHCSQCDCLDNELKDCLEAKTLKKAMLTSQENGQGDKMLTAPRVDRSFCERMSNVRATGDTDSWRGDSKRPNERNQPHFTFQASSRGDSGILSKSNHQPLYGKGRNPQRKEWKPKKQLSEGFLF